jgi:hypothetical protein
MLPPTSVPFQLATSPNEPPAGDGLLCEVKHDADDQARRSA